MSACIRIAQMYFSRVYNHFCWPRRNAAPKLDKVTGETGEAIDDLRNIAQLGYDESEDQEELSRCRSKRHRICPCCGAVMS